jgi:peptidoglycan hydrolase-like protein with peptidoglycan-binding domain
MVSRGERKLVRKGIVVMKCAARDRRSPTVLVLAVLAAMLSIPLNLAAQDKAAEASPTEITFWNSVKDSKNAEEIKAYLEVFPNGAFAPLARLRLKELLSPQPSPAQAAPGTAADLDEQAVRDVQERLYNLNYKITAINGSLGKETTEAIGAFQERTGQPKTGQLTKEQLEKLRAIEPPTIWGALAVSSDNIIEALWNLPSRREAEGRSLLACKNRAGSECRTIAVAGRQCAAAASWRETTPDGKTVWSITISRQSTLAAAQIAALEICNKHPKSQGRCDLTAKLCANGSHLSK